MRIFYLNKNKLRTLCFELGELSSLEGLDLSDNFLLSFFFFVFSGIRTLREFRFYYIDLEEIFVVIFKFFYYFELLGLVGNYLKFLFKEIVNEIKFREIYLK